MTRILLTILAVLEMAAGLFGLIGATRLFFTHDVGMVMIFWPVLVTFALFLVASAAIFARRPWSYYLHIGVILLIGALDGLYLGRMFGGADWGQFLLPIATVVVLLTVIFLLPPVRRFFGV